MKPVKKGENPRNIRCSNCPDKNECVERAALLDNVERIHCNRNCVVGREEAHVSDPNEERSKHGWCMVKHGSERRRTWL